MKENHEPPRTPSGGPESRAPSGFDPLRNRFEIEAGLEAGGYVRRGRPIRKPGTPR